MPDKLAEGEGGKKKKRAWTFCCSFKPHQRPYTATPAHVPDGTRIVKPLV